MGAAGSVQAIYLDATNWFQTYFDTDLYINDFQTIDKDNDGGVTFSELNRWVKNKSETEGGPWKVFLDNPEVLHFAHEMAAMRFGEHFVNSRKKMFTITDFRTFLVQYFAISILWVHFKNAEDHSGKLDQKANELQMTFDEFKLAVGTLTETHNHEKVNDEQLRSDFATMDTNNSDTLSFLEVCTYCCRFMDPNHESTELPVSPTTKQMKNQRETMELLDEMKSLADPNADGSNVALPPELRHELDYVHAAGSADDADRSQAYKPERRSSSVGSAQLKNMLAVDDLAQILDREKSTTKLAEFKVETEQAMAELLGGED